MMLSLSMMVLPPRILILLVLHLSHLVIEVHLFLLEQAQGLLGGLGAFLFVFEYVYRLVVIVAVGIQQEGLARVGLQIQTRIHLGTVFGCELRFYLTVLALSELDLVKQG
mmetsp:Transcript_41850/g.64028  ORF Transcript_41850/g.64028 Transcript_41850/m.64028 type:complete len:110 (-) Transcript_41850:824-1153(-)